jgi:hypothetical protein
VKVSVSKTARWMIGRRGGELWVWAAPMGDAAMIRTSTSGRNDRTFDPVRLDGVVVWFEQYMAIDDVTIGWTPFTGFDVTHPETLRMPSGSADSGN